MVKHTTDCAALANEQGPVVGFRELQATVILMMTCEGEADSETPRMVSNATGAALQAGVKFETLGKVTHKLSKMVGEG